MSGAKSLYEALVDYADDSERFLQSLTDRRNSSSEENVGRTNPGTDYGLPEGRIPFHMPGHKRQRGFGGELPYRLDITEIDGFDNLHSPEGLLLGLCERASRLWNSAESFPLINGSTCGILAGIRTLTEYGDEILMARGCHRSVYHALELCGLKPIYLPARFDPGTGLPLSESADEIGRMLDEHPSVHTVLLVSPTYEGCITDLRPIAEAVHCHGGRLMVDQAHGAHLGLARFFPDSAIDAGADLVIASLHKTLPALTQTALAHLSPRVDAQKFRRNLAVFETSSPSYLLMASIDRCLTLLEEHRELLFSDYADRLSAFRERLRPLRQLRVIGYNTPIPHRIDGFDRGKIYISTAGCRVSGFELADLLRKNYRIEPEMATPDGVLAMTSIADPDIHFEVLADALVDLDAHLTASDRRLPVPDFPLPVQVCTIAEANALEGESIALDDAVGRISLDTVFAYPPGIPLIVPGERIDRPLSDRVAFLVASGAEVLTRDGKFSGSIFVKAQKRD